MNPEGHTRAPLDWSFPSTWTLQTCQHMGQLSKVLHQGKWLLEFPICSKSTLPTLRLHAECRHQGYRGSCTAAWGLLSHVAEHASCPQGRGPGSSQPTHTWMQLILLSSSIHLLASFSVSKRKGILWNKDLRAENVRAKEGGGRECDKPSSPCERFASRPKGRRPDPAPVLDKQISCRQAKLATGWNRGESWKACFSICTTNQKHWQKSKRTSAHADLWMLFLEPLTSLLCLSLFFS